MMVAPRDDAEYSLQRLRGILGRRRLAFNPYTVSDRRLLELVETVGWGNDLDITQMVILQFTRLRETADRRNFDGIHFRLGNDADEGFIPTSVFTGGVTANDSLRLERSWIGKKPIRHAEEVASLVGKRVFVSRVIRGVNIRLVPRCAYKMHRLVGKPSKDAKVIREAMIDAKVEMLNRMLNYPESAEYLSCNKGLIDYRTPIQEALDIIGQYPAVMIPED